MDCLRYLPEPIAADLLHRRNQSYACMTVSRARTTLAPRRAAL